jgi:hypothetical protein
MAETRQTTKTTKVFAPAGFRFDAPAGVSIYGYQSENNFIALIETVINAKQSIKINWWVAFADTQPAGEPPPEPPPDPDDLVITIPPGQWQSTLVISGVEYHIQNITEAKIGTVPG